MSNKGLELPASGSPGTIWAWAATDALTLLEGHRNVQWRSLNRLEDDYTFAYSFKSFEEAVAKAGRTVANHWVEVRAALARSLVQDSGRFRGRRDQRCVTTLAAPEWVARFQLLQQARHRAAQRRKHTEHTQQTRDMPPSSTFSHPAQTVFVWLPMQLSKLPAKAQEASSLSGCGTVRRLEKPS